MKLTFLGTGTSTGVPQIGCTCAVCKSTDVRDKRLRSSALIENEGTRVLIDCGPDFRAQMLSLNDFRMIDAVFITHEHYDHVGGLDDLRPYSNFIDVPVYADEGCVKSLRERMPYCFAEHKYPGVPQIELKICRLHEQIKIGKTEIIPFLVWHGKLPILGFRIGKLAYITDMKTLDDSELKYLQGVEVLVVNGLRVKPHPTHQSIEEAIRFAQKVGSERSYLIHMSHDAGLAINAERTLPPNVFMAYDGLSIEI